MKQTLSKEAIFKGTALCQVRPSEINRELMSKIIIIACIFLDFLKKVFFEIVHLEWNEKKTNSVL